MVKTSNSGVVSRQVIEEYFDNWYGGLVVFAQRFLDSREDAEDIVQNVFLKLYEKFESGQSTVIIKTYLYNSVRNDCLNFIRHQKVKNSNYSGSIFKQA